MEPKEPPPSYTEAQASASTSTPQHLEVPHKTRNGIPPQIRRSMEDESRPLPSGWVRQYDSQTHHQFFVDTTSSPPRSIWHHPYDDSTYLASLDPEERQRVQALHRVPTHADIEAESSGDDHSHQEGEVTGMHKFGRKMKDKMTGSTHEERAEKRRRREEEEREAYKQHLYVRQQMAKAAETGEPQLVGKDREGKDVFVEPPYGGASGGGYGAGGMGAYGGGFQGGGYGYSPYGMGRGGVYGDPNARFIRPQGPYARPYGGGFGGGYGMPLLGLGGGLMLGSLLF